ncbi:MAG: histidine kinase [Alphaproteobacteria bacterium]|nr:histidine kinase [Alphaproteobacteria bacterium]MBU0796908.1 histidine kinase [Alphaproteobacteria bacterium]MBU0886448.1 histidine kinase [Alphaproteobacteria bacterium]MBU1812329.1 histidine kinase [Alphaproteobacteria bacterium]
MAGFFSRTGFLLAGFLLVGLLLFCSQGQAAPYRVGADVPYDLYEDSGAQIGLDEFLALPAGSLETRRRALSQGYTDSAFWLRFTLPADMFKGDALWMQLSPVYLDELTLYSRTLGGDAPWQHREAGDRWGAPDDDLDYRFPVYAFAPPGPAGEGYEIILRVRSTSAVILVPTLWQPAAFLGQAAWTTSFWSVYFGMAVFSSALALLLAIYLNSRTLWSISSVSVVYLGIASVQGYVTWVLGDIWGPLQHFLTSVTTLLTYSTVFWMTAEVLNLRSHSPRFYRAVLVAVGLSLLLQFSIPLGLYAFAKNLQFIICLIIGVMAVHAIIRLLRLRRLLSADGAIVILPVVLVATGLMQELMLQGYIGFSPVLFGQWQFMMMAIMLMVMILIVNRIRDERRMLAEQQQMARELRVEREASFNQRQFMAMVSHEFRTPLAVISAALQNLRLQPAAWDEVEKRHDKIRRAADRLSQMTDNCLADARLTSETLYLDTSPVDLIAEIRSAAGLVEMSDSHRLQLTLEGRPAAGETVILQADSALLRIAFSNVLDNAMKYSERGNVYVDVARREGVVIVAIRDQGRGIAEDQVAHIFERYRRAGNSGGVYRRGAGLGLFVARQIALAHDGDLVLAANTPQGCCFEFRLPERPATMADE